MAKITELKKMEVLYFNVDGVHLNIKLDYEKSEVSFVEHDPETGGVRAMPQKFIFSERDRKYLGGWVKILNALEQVTRIADKKLKEQAEIRETLKTEKYINIWTTLKEKKS